MSQLAIAIAILAVIGIALHRRRAVTRFGTVAMATVLPAQQRVDELMTAHYELGPLLQRVEQAKAHGERVKLSHAEYARFKRACDVRRPDGSRFAALALLDELPPMILGVPIEFTDDETSGTLDTPHPSPQN